ncbi:hypothetical protein TrST_g10890 [Triparma strigata]|uniref:Uncharacterized protein n=1 Tax=Triparma strigata TaxID=1606541 RepID=A0A9W6ZU47_9STRA|nr:hypothetical protein TrST_g10890 [Triparma strigata]
MNKAVDERNVFFSFEVLMGFFTDSLPEVAIHIISLVVVLSPSYRAAAGLGASAALPLVDTISDVLVVMELHAEDSPYYIASLCILAFSSLNAGSFAVWESFYGGEGNFSSSALVNAGISFFLGILNIRIQVLALMLAYKIIVEKVEPATLRICEADPIDMGTSFVVFSLLTLLNVITESVLELLLQSYIVVEDYFQSSKMPEWSLIFSLMIGCMAYASALVGTFMHRNTNTVQVAAFFTILSSTVARVASLVLFIYFAGAYAGFGYIIITYALSCLYNVQYHFDWADLYDFGPGGKHEKLFHLFIDTQIVFLAPLAYSGKDGGNDLYDEGEVRTSYPGKIHGLPISFTKDNALAEGNFITKRAWLFAIFRSFECAGLALVVLLSAGDGSEDPTTEVLTFVAAPAAFSLLLHSFRMYMRRRIIMYGSAREFDSLVSTTATKKKKKKKVEGSGCRCLMIPCCGYVSKGAEVEDEDGGEDKEIDVKV